MGSMRAAENDKPSCCKKGESFEEFFRPGANSSFIDAQTESSFSDDGQDDDTGDDHDNTFSSIKSADTSHAKSRTVAKPQESVPSCCMSKVRPIERKIVDASLTSAPRSPPLSRTFGSSVGDRYNTQRATYNTTSKYASSVSGRDSSMQDSSYYAASHVPRPSRNYHTYDDSQPSTYFGTPMPASYRTQFDQSWGSSLNDTLLSSRSDGMRSGTYNAGKYSTPLPRNARMVPGINRTYLNPNMSRQVNPAIQSPYTRNYVQSPYSSPYKQAGMRSFKPQSRANYKTHSLQDESAYAQLADTEMPSFAGRPQSTPIYLQRRSPQTKVRPQSASVPPELPPCCRSGDDKVPACCKGGEKRPKTADATVDRRKSSYCSDNACGKRSGSKKVESFCNDNTCSRIGLVSDKTQTCIPQANVGCQSGSSAPGRCGGGCDDDNEDEETLDTLLEIRTPHRSPGGAAGMPFVLSINVSCADRSVVITPDKGYKAISSSTSSQM